MALLLKNARVIDPQVSLDKVSDVLIRDGIIVSIGHDLEMKKGVERDLTGKVLVPGLVDMHVHFRDPGYEYKEDIASGSRAAAHGGFTAVCTMPNTYPVTDTGVVIDYIKSQANKVAKCRIYPSGACTKGLKGEILAEMGDMAAAGAVAFTDDGRGVQNSGMMRRVMEYATQFRCCVLSHCQDESLVGDGRINEGEQSFRLGLAPWPVEGEELQIMRDIMLSRLTKCPLHIQHITTARGLSFVREAKKEGLSVTCEVTPQHLFLNDAAIGDEYDTNCSVNPPLRTVADNDALIDGIRDGSIDCIVTDHAPHAEYEKEREFETAPFGMIGLETSLGLILTNLLHPGLIDWNRLIDVMAVSPRRILGVDPVVIEPGSVADLTVIDPDMTWRVEAKDFQSKAKNSPFIGYELKGRATDVYVGGYATMEEGVVLA